MPLLLSRKCVACGHEFELMQHRDELFAIDHPFWDAPVSDDVKGKASRDGSMVECPECLCSDLRAIVTCGLGIDLGGEAGVGREYPYDDQNLGMRIHSKAHHREVCKRLGIEQADHGMQVEIDNHRARRKQIAEDAAAYNEMREMQAADPDIRRAQDILERVMKDAGSDPAAQREALKRM